MNNRSVRHRGLKCFIEHDDPREFRRDLEGRARKFLSALLSTPDRAGVQGPPGWRLHQLAGDRAGTWSPSVSGNRRIAFEIEDAEIVNLDLEDYHR